MNRLVIVVALTCMTLLGGILYELHGLNRRLDTAGAAVTSALTPRPIPAVEPETPEERTERLEREVAERKRTIDDAVYVMRRGLGLAATPPQTRK